MWPIYIAFAASSLLAIAAGYGYLTGQDDQSQFIFGEIFKAALGFALVAAAGGVIKNVGESVLESQREQRARATRKEERRQEILHEFSSVYSEFYSLRKLWHSARSSHNHVYSENATERQRLVSRLLERAVELEGRYGALKLAAIRHFDLPRGDYGTKSTEELENKILSASDPREKTRLRLDLLGENYDDWRHALEQDRKIRPGDALWKSYEEILEYFDREDQ